MGTELKLVTYKGWLTDMLSSGDLPLPSTVDPESFRNAAIVAFTDNPDIATCSAESIFKALRRLGQMGLIPDGVEAALVAHNNKQRDGSFVREATAMPMYQGLIKRARNSGEVKSIWSDVVYEGEKVAIWIDEVGERRWNHVAADGSTLDAMSRGGNVVGAIAVARMTDGAIEFEPMTRAQIDQVRAASKMPNGPAWSKWFEEMAKKSVLRRLCKRLPLDSTDRRMVLESDEDTIGMRDVTPRAPTATVEDEAPARQVERTKAPARETGTGAPPEKQAPRKPVEPKPDPAEKPKETKRPDAPKPSTKAKPETEPEPEPEVEDAEVVDEEGSGDPVTLGDALQTVYDRIIEDLQNASDADSINGLVGLFEDQIAMIGETSEEAHGLIEQAISDAHERVSS